MAWQMISEPFPSWKCGPHIRGRVCPVGGWIVVTQKRVLHFMESHIATSPRIETLALIPSVMPRPRVHDIVLFGRPEGSFSPSRFCSSPGCVGKKALYTTREGIPYKHIPMCFLRQCGILWNARLPFRSFQSTPFTGKCVLVCGAYTSS